MIGTVTVDGWTVTFGTTRRGLGASGRAAAPPSTLLPVPNDGWAVTFGMARRATDTIEQYGDWYSDR